MSSEAPRQRAAQLFRHHLWKAEQHSKECFILYMLNIRLRHNSFSFIQNYVCINFYLTWWFIIFTGLWLWCARSNFDRSSFWIIAARSYTKRKHIKGMKSQLSTNSLLDWKYKSFNRDAIKTTCFSIRCTRPGSRGYICLIKSYASSCLL